MTDSTDLAGYDIVMAVTQEAINDMLIYSTIWSQTINYYAKTKSATPPQDEAKNIPIPQSQCVGLFNATMSTPTISLTLPSGATNTNQVAVTLAFTGGVLNTPGSGRGIQLVYTDITGYTIEFNVDIALSKVVDLNSSQPVAVQEAISNVNLSVSMLFLNLIEISWTDAVISDSTGTKVTDLTIINSLETYIQGWYSNQEAAEQQAGILSWTQAAGSDYTPPNAIPAFVPTAYSFSVSPYTPASPDNDKLGTINFLMMTQGRALPTASTAGIFDTNWVPAPNTEEYQGVLVIRGDLFTSGFVEAILLPEIATLIGANDPRFGGKAPVISSLSMNQWEINQSFTLYGDENDGKGQVLNSFCANVYQKYDESVSCTVTLDPTTATYTINGSYDAKMTITSAAFGLLPESYYVPYSQPWSFTVILKAGADGAISCSASTVTPGTAPSSNGVAVGNDFLGDLDAIANSIVSSITDTYASDFNAAASKLEQTATDTLGAALAPAMTSLSSNIIFPGSYDYAYKSLTFSTGGEQNLLTNITILS